MNMLSTDCHTYILMLYAVVRLQPGPGHTPHQGQPGEVWYRYQRGVLTDQ